MSKFVDTNTNIIETNYDYEKTTPLSEVMKYNNIDNIIFTFNLISNNYINTLNNIDSTICLYFNEKLIEWVDNVIYPFIEKNKLNIEIKYNSIINL